MDKILIFSQYHIKLNIKTDDYNVPAISNKFSTFVNLEAGLPFKDANE